MRTIKIQIVVFVSIIAAMLGLEEARWRIFYTPKAWPAKFDPKLGFVFTPGAMVTHTNDVAFHVTQQANSLGFLDREPARVTDSCRVLPIGDSFVEAARGRGSIAASRN